MIGNRTPFTTSIAVFTLALTAESLTAQQSELMRFDVEPHLDSSGVREGVPGPLLDEHGDKNLTPVYLTAVRSPGANMIRVHFNDFDLDEHSEMLLLSAQDGAVQHFNHSMLTEWNGWSAIFNGDTVLVQLLAAPNETVSFTIEEVAVNDPEEALLQEALSSGVDINGLCGSDMRGPSSDSRVGRLSSASCGDRGNCGGCTGWLTSIGAVLTAGHCGGQNGIIEFNVPASNSNGMPNAADPDDQYPLGVSFYAFQDAGIGFDWGILSVGPNANTGLRAHWIQGYFHLSPNNPGIGSTLRVTGYGVDAVPTGSSPQLCCAWNDDGDCILMGCNATSLTLQTATGPLTNIFSNSMQFRVSAQPANSGSPLIRNSNGFAHGILTHGGCTSNEDTWNSGTRLTQSSLVDWLNTFVGADADTRFVDFANVSGTMVGTALNPYRTVPQGVDGTPDGGFVAMAGGSYPAAAGNSGLFDQPVTLTAVSGVVTIGN